MTRTRGAHLLLHLGVRATLSGLCLGTGPSLHGQTVWQAVETEVTFVIRNAGFPVDGSFEPPQMHIVFDPERPADGELSGALDPSTIKTGIGLRDRHLQRREYFHVERFPTVTLRSVALDRADPTGFRGTFLLRIRDVEREVDMPFAFERDGEDARLSGTLTIDRLDFGLGEPSRILADDVTIRLEASLRRMQDRQRGPALRVGREEGLEP